MDDNILAIIEESKSLNSKVFSLPRLQLLASLYTLKQDGATYRELKAALDLDDGVLYSNLKALEKMGYLKSIKVTFENKELESFTITTEGETEWERTKEWLCKFLGCGGDKNEEHK